MPNAVRTPPAPFSGGCACGATRYLLKEEPLTLYACHCTDCQKRSGGAFGLSMWVRLGGLECVKGEPAALATDLGGGRASRTRICPQCGTRLWTEAQMIPGKGVLHPGTLDDTSWLEPVAHLWTRSAQPWVRMPTGVVSYATQPDDMEELVRLWRERGG